MASRPQRSAIFATVRYEHAGGASRQHDCYQELPDADWHRSVSAAPAWGTIANTDVSGLGTLATANAATPPAIGGSTPAAGAFTTLTLTTPLGGAYGGLGAALSPGTGTGNTAIGALALSGALTSNNSVAVGGNALKTATTSGSNTAVGFDA